MLTLSQIKRGLADRSASIVARATGLHYNTVRDVRSNPDTNPTYKVMLALSDYIEHRMNENG